MPKNKINTPGDIFYAITKQDCSTIRKWVKTKPNMNQQNSSGQSALIAAVLTGNIKLVKIILKTDVNVNKADARGATALDVAAEHEYVKIARELIKHGGTAAIKKNSDWVIKITSKKSSSSQGNSLWLLVNIPLAILLFPVTIAMYSAIPKNPKTKPADQ